MNKQIEITQPTDLLDSNGNVSAKGWAKRPIVNYNKHNIPENLRIRKKEWDFYQTSNGTWMVQLNFANISIGSGATCSVVNLSSGERYDSAYIVPFTKNRFELESKNAECPSNFEFKKGNTRLSFSVTETGRVLEFTGFSKGKHIDVHLEMKHIPDNESITIVTPFDTSPDRFFLTTKYNCMPTDGFVKIEDEFISFDKKNTFTVLDWGRGVWPHKNFWYWGNGSTVIDSKYFGFELTWGIGNTECATETCLFYDGKAHKIGKVWLEKEPKDNGYMKEWVFKSEDNRFNLTMKPFFDNKSGMLFLNLLGMKTHQVHGLWNGTVVLDSGKVLEIKDMYAFCEYVENLW